MPTTLSARAVRPPQKSHRSDLDVLTAKAATIRMDSEAFRTAPMANAKAECLDLIEAARVHAGMSKKEMAHYAGCPESALSEALNGGRGHFAAAWLWAQPDKYWLSFMELSETRKQLKPETRLAVKAARIAELVRLLVEVA